MTSGDVEGGSLTAAILALRKRLGWSQVRLATEVGVTERTVKRWENGSRPGDDHRLKLIALGVDAKLFLDAEQRAEIEKRLRAVEAEVAKIRGFLA